MENTEATVPGYVPTELFGGAMSINLPQEFKDMSKLRPIPDNQELYASSTSDRSIIVELLERVGRDSDAVQSALAELPEAETLRNLPEDAIAMAAHIHDICSAHGDRFEFTEPPTLHIVPHLPGPSYACRVKILEPLTLKGPGGEILEGSKITTAHILMIRLEQYQSDILILVNAPQPITLQGEATNTSNEDHEGQEILAQLGKSVKVLDYSVFVLA